ncbi:LysE family transporter [Alicyclobacillus fodiniaquatilis]|uniref:LysE family transporter n=1 Tax=Alicyclobacillus fodiniaquatilis TaxID=1661150 RepID=A0ABW4JP74_9BACL
MLSYVLLGLSLSAPIGPINAAQLDKGMKYGFLNAWMVGLGAMTADVLYMLLIYFGLAKLFTLPGVKLLLWVAGSVILMYIGLETLLNLRRLKLSTVVAGESSARSFLTGFFMAVSNPMNFVFWFGIYGAILSKAAEQEDNAAFLGHSCGIFVGILIWDIAMALAASMFQQYANRRVLQTVSALAGLSLVGFAGYFAFQAQQALF